jgi:hypothetical protein
MHLTFQKLFFLFKVLISVRGRINPRAWCNWKDFVNWKTFSDSIADDVNLLGDNIDTIEKNSETLIDASKEVGIEINVEKTKYMLLSRHQNAGRNRGHRNSKQIIWKCVTIQIFVDDSNKSKFDSGGNYVEIEFG